MYFEIDEDDRIILCPEDHKDIEKLERVYNKLRHKGLEQIEVILELPKEGKQRIYSHPHMQNPHHGFGFTGATPEGLRDMDVYAHNPFFHPAYNPFMPLPWYSRYGYDTAAYERSGEYGRQGVPGTGNPRSEQRENPRDTGRGDAPRR